MKISQEVIDSILRNSGGTFRLDSNRLRLTRLTSGYFTSITNFSIPVSELKPGFSLPYFYVQALNSGYYLGFWIDSGQVYIDLSMLVKERLEALAIGRSYDQTAIWDIEASKAIDIDYKGY